ncbi:MAG TPA: 5-(carboxyamino)imidazole ribonucleotide synthase [Candidatus Sulfotelmatobacter sp.]|jgi:phosphoribosylaminoimidazole carboxylase PurK protein|nr:5-(carboxyamino)imidazole ribonucleotide synthase [Candidatus Sulfotelmatobacter sp.]
MQKRIGIVGGGQLGRLIAIDAKKLGFTVNIIDPTPNSPAGQVADYQIVADYNDEKAIRELAKISDYLTFEIELANAEILDELSRKGLKINPSAKTLSIIKDKLVQKQFLKKAKIPVADFVEIDSKKEILQVAKKYGYPFLLKARFDAYDGRGNALITKESDIDNGVKKLQGRKLYIEKFVPFIKELAVMVGRNTKNEIISYPVVETIHKNNILHLLVVPAPIDSKIQIKAQRLAEKVMRQLKGAGMFGIEMFLLEDGKILINEIAPRVHNSGHYTIEATETSQFEQHARAIADMPFGSTKLKTPAAVMINILGERDGKAKQKGVAEAGKIPGVTVHIYGKLQTRKERKMGHLTAIGETIEEALKKAKKARKLITI